MPSSSPGSSMVPERKVRGKRDRDFSWKPEAGFSRATTVFSSLRGLQRTWTLIDACIFMLCEHVKPGGGGEPGFYLLRNCSRGSWRFGSQSRQAHGMRPPLEGGAVCGLGVVSFFLLPLPAPTHPAQFHPNGLPDIRSASGTGDLCP